jgi:hypothetical protein
VGLDLHPPEHAVVLCVDEKSQIQALTQPGLPLKKGRCGTMTHDYQRHGTATLFAAWNAADGTVISMCDDRHRHQERLQFLRVIDSIIPPDKQLHLVVDNYATHKQRKVQRWLAQAPPFSRAFHANQQFLAQYGGTFPPGPNRKAHPPWRFPRRRRADYGNRRLYRSAQQLSETIYLDSQGERHPRENEACPQDAG